MSKEQEKTPLMNLAHWQKPQKVEEVQETPPLRRLDSLVKSSSQKRRIPETPLTADFKQHVEAFRYTPKMNSDHKKLKVEPKLPEDESGLDQLLSMFPQKSRQECQRALEKHAGNMEAAINGLISPEKVSPVTRPKRVPMTIAESDSEDEVEDEVEFIKEELKEPELKKQELIEIKDESQEESDEETGAESDDEELTRFFNDATEAELLDMLQCSVEQAQLIMGLRPFDSYEDMEKKISKTKGINGRLLEKYYEMQEMYSALDQLVTRCDSISDELKRCIRRWTAKESVRASRESSVALTENGGEEDEEDGMHLSQFSQRIMDGLVEDVDLVRTQPDFINPELALKDYQLVGLSWLNLLHRKELSGILADEMGLGKTAQIISFIGLLVSRDPAAGPFLIVAPSSTTENWLREFQKWCSGLEVRHYYGSQTERLHMRDSLWEEYGEFDVIVTTYNMISGSKDDRSFLRKMKFKYMILDEGHMVKNVSSQRYKHLMSIRTPFRLLLTGTPLQNNLQELMALLMFIMPDLFAENETVLQHVFSMKSGDLSDLTKQRIEKAKKMMMPFILRRKKADVMKDLPPKIEQVIYCEPTVHQRDMYKSLLIESKKSFKDVEPTQTSVSRRGKKLPATDTAGKLSNILMQLRKMSCHPLLHRHHYTEAILAKMSREILKDEQFWDSDPKYVYEDMSVMSDFELHQLCCKHRVIQKYKLDDKKLMDSGKIEYLTQKILPENFEKKNRLLIFSQFTIMLDVLEDVLKACGYKYLRLDGQTPVNERQALIDEYTTNDEYFIFLLSTKAGGFGINLISANVVVLYDLDFNPHNDAQAEDRAHRVGQTRDVSVIKMITKGTVEEQIYRCAQAKLRLDRSISTHQSLPEDAASAGEDASSNDVNSILQVLRAEFMQEE